MEEKLIQFVKENTFLYDKRRSSYRKIDEKEKKWRELAGELNLPVEQIKRRWVTLRDRYKREKKDCFKASGSGASPKRECKFFQIMRFLDDTPSENLKTSGNYADEDDFEIEVTEIFDSRHSTPDFTEILSPKQPAPTKRRKPNAPNINEELKKAQNEMTEVLELAKSSFQPSSSMQLFFASIASSLEDASLPTRVVSNLKIKIFNIVQEEILKNLND